MDTNTESYCYRNLLGNTITDITTLDGQNYINDGQIIVSTDTTTSYNWDVINRLEMIEYINFLHKLLNIPFTYEEFMNMDDDDKKKVLRDKIIDDLIE